MDKILPILWLEHFQVTPGNEIQPEEFYDASFYIYIQCSKQQSS